MSTRVALLRGINVGGHKKIPMQELRQVAESLGFEGPKTYVQSGNLLFETDLDENQTIEALEAALEKRFGFEVPVVSRSAEELAEIGRSHPYSDLGLDERMLMVAFLDRVPGQAVEEAIDAETYLPDRFEGNGREIYLAYPEGSGRSKLSHSLFEKRLRVRATLRNWKTVCELLDLTGTGQGG